MLVNTQDRLVQPDYGLGSTAVFPRTSSNPLIVSARPLRILLELRPALGGHAGIPQATRLLFRSLASYDDLEVSGLLQSGERMLSVGLPAKRSTGSRKLSTDQEVNRLGRVVIDIDERRWDELIQAIAHTVFMTVKHVMGGRLALSHFDGKHFRDFLWRRYFSRTLPPEDFEIVTRTAFRIARIPWLAMQINALVTRGMGHEVYPRLNTSDFDVMVAETPYPATVSKNTRFVIRYHDAIPMLMPHTISDRRFHHSFHYRSLRHNVANGAWFACVSEATRKDLLSIFPQAESRAVTIHNMVSHDYFPEESVPERVSEIVQTRLNGDLKPRLDNSIKRVMRERFEREGPLKYLLMVSTIEPRKNHLSLLTAWEKLRLEGYPDLKIILVGAPGWRQKRIIEKFRVWIDRTEVFLLHDVPASELRVLYRHASATVCPSSGEGFDFSGVEAMKSGGAVVASDIPVHREVYANAAAYFNPYSVRELAQALVSVIGPLAADRRAELVANGAINARRYDHDAVLPRWRELFTEKTGETR
jgi:glycosyltransferase involved in cell wall biosynthesis